MIFPAWEPRDGQGRNLNHLRELSRSPSACVWDGLSAISNITPPEDGAAKQHEEKLPESQVDAIGGVKLRSPKRKAPLPPLLPCADVVY